MTETILISIMSTGFVVAFAHAAIPTHWLPFVLAGRGQRWGKPKTLAIVALCGAGHVLFTTVLGALVVWAGIETSKWTGDIFPWIAGGALIAFGLYYLARQARGGGHGHHHFFGGHDHGDDGHDHGGHSHGDHGHSHGKGGHSHDHGKGGHSHDHGKGGHSHDHGKGGHSHGAGDHDHAGHSPDHEVEDQGRVKRIDTGEGILLLEIAEQGGVSRFRVKTEANEALPKPEVVTIDTLNSAGVTGKFSFVNRGGYLESVEAVQKPLNFTARVGLLHGDHDHYHTARFQEGAKAAAASGTARAAAAASKPAKVKSDGAVILSLFMLLTFSPCEGFIPVFISGIQYGWPGFLLLSAVLATATVLGMMSFTWLTLAGIERLNLRFLEKYEAGILGTIVLFLGIGIIFFGF